MCIHVPMCVSISSLCTPLLLRAKALSTFSSNTCTHTHTHTHMYIHVNTHTSCLMHAYMYTRVHVLMRDEKEGRKKVKQTTIKAKQHSTPKAVTCKRTCTFVRKVVTEARSNEFPTSLPSFLPLPPSRPPYTCTS